MAYLWSTQPDPDLIGDSSPATAGLEGHYGWLGNRYEFIRDHAHARHLSIAIKSMSTSMNGDLL